MSNELFPSGPWRGYYNYRPGDRHWMDLHLTFSNSVISGNGNDDVGPFIIKGKYDSTSGECYWTKSYLGAHDVFYRGFREGKGIWGTWEIRLWNRGGFHIWPKGATDGEAAEETNEQIESADAISTLEAGYVPTAPASTK